MKWMYIILVIFALLTVITAVQSYQLAELENRLRTWEGRSMELASAPEPAALPAQVGGC
ncbi:MAG TPA: hypothetical protein VJH24_01495 [Candidatus Bilamarchaeaceae archaeon]|nr:hypothetical protein [Candidatus Bilamarchaeaceae archaeon]